MSLLFIEGFDHLSSMDEKWDASTNATDMIPTPGTGRFGGQALILEAISAGAGSRTKNIIDSPEVILGAAYILDAAVGINGVFGTATRFDDFQFGMAPGSGIVTLSYVGGTSGTITISTPASTVTSGTWFFIEFRVKAHPSLGEMEIRVNNVTEASTTGIDTIGADGGDIVNFRYGTSANNATTAVDDLYCLNTSGTSNNTFLGDCRVATLHPKANGIVNNFTPSDGTSDQFTMVDETLVDFDATYVESGVVGAREAYDNEDFTDIGISPGTIFGVQVVNTVKKTDAAELRYRNQMVIAGVPFDTGVDVQAPASLYKMTTYIRDTDPSDDATWTEAKVDAVGSGIEIKFRAI